MAFAPLSNLLTGYIWHAIYIGYDVTILGRILLDTSTKSMSHNNKYDLPRPECFCKMEFYDQTLHVMKLHEQKLPSCYDVDQRCMVR